MTSDACETAPRIGEDDDDNAAMATAFWICGVRASEFRKGNAARIKDPYAERLMCEWAWKRQKSLFRLNAAVVHRTNFYDSKIIMSARDYGVRQLVAIGAGLDTRAFRLLNDYPDMHVIEVDHPNMFSYKEPRLKDVKPVCKRSIVALKYDEVTEWDVRAKELVGFDPSKPTVFVIEGVTMYLKPEEEIALYEKIDKNAAPNSVITGCNLRLLSGGRQKNSGEWHYLVQHRPSWDKKDP